MTDDELPAASNVVTQAGPWTVLSCVTASCTRCGSTPLDEDTQLTPHFTSTAQAREELTRDWGWTYTPGRTGPKTTSCCAPDCAKAGGPCP